MIRRRRALQLLAPATFLFAFPAPDVQSPPLPNIEQKSALRLVIGTSEKLSADIGFRAFGVYVGNYSDRWVEIPEANEFVPPKTRQVIPLPGVEVALALFATPPTVPQPAGVPGQTCFLTYTERNVQPSGGLIGTSVVGTATQVTLERFARAALPAPGNAGRLVELTDDDRAMWLDDGTQFWDTAHHVVDIEAFHAVAGAADNSVPLQAAINSLPLNGGIVLYGPGVWNNLTKITFGKGVRLIGAGKHATIPVGQYETLSGLGGGQEIAHLQMQVGNAALIPLNIKGVDHFNLHDARFYGAMLGAIQLDHDNVGGAYTHTLDNLEIDGSVTAGSFGIRLTNT